MTDISEERVSAYVDGQLDGEALLDFKSRLVREPSLAERVAAHQWMSRQVTAAYGPPPEANEDDALIAHFGLGTGQVVPLSDHQLLPVRRGQFKFAAVTALAASLALVLIAGSIALTSTSSIVRVPEGPRIASGILAASLSDQLSGEPGRVRIGISFRTDQGVCRTFRSDQDVSGIGCRNGDHWVVPMISAADSQKHAITDADYRLAGEDISPAVMAEVDRRIRGEPLSPPDELRQRQRHWR